MANEFLAAQRLRMFSEIDQKPSLLNALASIGESENSGKPHGILESLFNRSAKTGQSLEQLINSGFYDNRTMRRLQFDMQNGVSPAVLANTRAALDQIRQGSNITHGATDQGGRSSIRGPAWQVGNEWYGDLGGSGQFRAQQQAQAARTEGGGSVPLAPWPGSAPPIAPAPARTAQAGNLPSMPGYNPSLGNVDPRLRHMLDSARTQFEAVNPGYRVMASSGYRPDDVGSMHQRGQAVDMHIVGPNGPIHPYGDDPTGLYRQYARMVYGHQLANYPELNGQFSWGGAHGTERPSGGPPDLEHFDLGGERGHWVQNRPSQMGAIMPTGASMAAAGGPAALQPWPGSTPATPATLPPVSPVAPPQASQMSMLPPQGAASPVSMLAQQALTPAQKPDVDPRLASVMLGNRFNSLSSGLGQMAQALGYGRPITPMPPMAPPPMPRGLMQARLAEAALGQQPFGSGGQTFGGGGFGTDYPSGGMT